MIALACLGAFLGVLSVLTMWRAGMLAERSGLAVLVTTLAVFYPVFAVHEGGGLISMGLYGATVVLFGWCAVLGFHRGSGILAMAFLGHGGFGALAIVIHHPGPDWWPAICAGYGVATGLCLLLMIQRREIS